MNPAYTTWQKYGWSILIALGAFGVAWAIHRQRPPLLFHRWTR